MTTTTTEPGGVRPCATVLGEDDVRAAAEQARRRYPGPVGELLHRELIAYARLGHRFTSDGDALLPHLTTHLLAPPGRTPASCGCPGRGPGPVPGLWPAVSRRSTSVPPPPGRLLSGEHGPRAAAGA
ncbi:hypothetical protein [Actinomycetospora straminea]|uniref:Uncharacterized protein n=1 Tax=Actinomycetospora straminea TaxID=663607 RepID=A0ABP9EGH1_9PSEU|nr:hypothetical protein [Actinomycetospora straminea]MDD7935666.1 hypothetical protein [Actinomycetospora straminea]